MLGLITTAGRGIASAIRWMFTTTTGAVVTTGAGVGVAIATSEDIPSADAVDATTPTPQGTDVMTIVVVASTVIGLLASGLYLYKELR